MLKKIPLNNDWALTCTSPCEGEKQKLFKFPFLEKNWIPASVPGDVHDDLIKHGKLDKDVLVGDNLEKARWTHSKDWWYYKTFKLDDSIKNKNRIELIFDGIDCIADVWINGGKYLGRCENMFQQYSFDITKFIAKENTVVVKLHSVDETRKPFHAQNKYWVSKDETRVYLRKGQAQFGWDWTPAFPSIGIWKDVYIKAYDNVCIDNVKITTKTNGEIFIHPMFNASIKKGEVEFKIEGHGTNIIHKKTFSGTKTFSVLKIKDPKLWWPTQYGEQPLYSCEVKLTINDKVYDTKKIDFGVCEISHVEERVNNDYLTWHLVVNSKKVFCQGVNFVPSSLFIGAVTKEQIRDILLRTKEAGFNMIRVWGGGIYESDYFYDLCDEMGVLVWQDFAFANADYPYDQEKWRGIVEKEISYQIIRLRNHPSLAVWCGANEKSTAFEDYGDDLSSIVESRKITDLFLTTIPGSLEHLDGTRPYVSGSPVSYSDLGNERSSGNTHESTWLRAYLHENKNMLEHRKHLKTPTSFKSEMFVMGATRSCSLKKMLPKEHIWPPDDVWKYKFGSEPEWDNVGFHEYQMNTNKIYFGIKNSSFTEFCKYSSIQQVEFGREEFESCRCQREICGGVMFWMMNDIWPTATWAIVDFYGVPKPMFYALKRACAPVMCAMVVSGDNYSIFVVNETNEKIKGKLIATYQVVDGNVIYQKELPYEVNPHSSFECLSIPQNGLIRTNAYVHLKLDDQKCLVENFYYPRPWRDYKYNKPDIQFRLENVKAENDGYRGTVILKSKQLARYVHMDIEPINKCIWSDNFFDLEPNQEKEITAWAPSNITEENLKIGHLLTNW